MIVSEEALPVSRTRIMVGRWRDRGLHRRTMTGARSGRRSVHHDASASSRQPARRAGAFDPLDEPPMSPTTAVAARRRGARQAWRSRRPAHKLRGIERADSIVWDAHKLLMMPALITAVLFKDGGHAYEAFAQQASYLFAASHPEATWWDLGQRTLERAKRAMAIELWAALRTLGEACSAT
jgi:L-2,4-diaminobutyrate decarboxylase